LKNKKSIFRRKFAEIWTEIIQNGKRKHSNAYLNLNLSCLTSIFYEKGCSEYWGEDSKKTRILPVQDANILPQIKVSTSLDSVRSIGRSVKEILPVQDANLIPQKKKYSTLNPVRINLEYSTLNPKVLLPMN
jgi:hypothetical protein